MPSYGQWIQAPDFAKNNRGTTSPASGVEKFGYFVSEESQAFSLGYPVPTTGEMQAAQVAANAAVTVGGLMLGNPPSGGPLDIAISHISSGGVPPTIATTRLEAQMTFQPSGVSPYQFGDSNWAPGPFLGTPPNAIGYQWQADMSEGGARTSTVISCVLSGGYVGEAVLATAGPVRTNVYIHDALFESEVTPPGVPSGSYTDNIVEWPGPGGTLLTTFTGPNVDEIVETTAVRLPDGRGARSRRRRRRQV